MNRGGFTPSKLAPIENPSEKINKGTLQLQAQNTQF